MAGEIRLPDIGDFKDVPIIEIHVKPGQTRRQGRGAADARERQGDARRPCARGRRHRRDQGQGRRQGEPGRAAGDLGDGGAASAPAPTAAPPRREAASARLRRQPRRPTRPISNATCWCSAPAPAAIPPPFAPPISARRSCWSSGAPTLGGVCLNVGCIPSKALLHVAKVIDEAADMSARMASTFGAPSDRSRRLAQLEGRRGQAPDDGLTGLARQRKVTVVTGEGAFTSPHTLAVETAEGDRDRALRHGDHRRRLRAGRAGLHPERPAHLGFDRRARTALHPQAPAGARRRHHRPGDGDGL